MDQAAFRSFYQKTAPALRAYIARSAGSVDIADDILQDVFMRFLLNAPSLGSEAAMRGYLYRTAETLVVDRWRQRQRESRRDQAVAELQGETVQTDYSDDINRAFRALKPQQRSLLWMAYVEEFDHREIASAAGLKEGSVRVLLARARKALAEAVNRIGHRPEASDVK
jgi:RNA polymerase sigma factor (sigma-70 family)